MTEAAADVPTSNHQKFNATLNAFHALCGLINQRGWYETWEKHMEAHKCFDLLLKYIQETLKEQQAQANLTPSPVPPVQA